MAASRTRHGGLCWSRSSHGCPAADDYVYYGETANGSLRSPDAVFALQKAEFDLPY